VEFLLKITDEMDISGRKLEMRSYSVYFSEKVNDILDKFSFCAGKRTYSSLIRNLCLCNCTVFFMNIFIKGLYFLLLCH